jgi:hypothetical protein
VSHHARAQSKAKHAWLYARSLWASCHSLLRDSWRHPPYLVHVTRSDDSLPHPSTSIPHTSLVINRSTASHSDAFTTHLQPVTLTLSVPFLLVAGLASTGSPRSAGHLENSISLRHGYATSPLRGLYTGCVSSRAKESVPTTLPLAQEARHPGECHL